MDLGVPITLFGAKTEQQMNILDRYFIREFLKPFGVCLVAFLLCMVVYDLYDNMNDFIQAKTPPGQILHYYSILVPSWIVQIMPITLLLSLLYALSDMSQHGELTAMRASGLDFFRLMSPYFLIGICVSIQMLSINLAWAPTALYKAKIAFEKSTQRLQENTNPAMEGITYWDMAGNRYWCLDTLNLNLLQATGIKVTQCDENQRDLREISARSGSYHDGFWIFRDVSVYDCTVSSLDPRSVQRFPGLAAHEFTESPQQMIAVSKKTKRMTTRELLQSLRYFSRLSGKQYAMFSTELHGRIAFPLAGFVVFLIGMPFGVIGQRRSALLAIVNALLLFFAYMLVTQLLFVFGQTGRITPWLAAWLPNILFTAIGIAMIRRIR